MADFSRTISERSRNWSQKLQFANAHELSGFAVFLNSGDLTGQGVEQQMNHAE